MGPRSTQTGGVIETGINWEQFQFTAYPGIPPKSNPCFEWIKSRLGKNQPDFAGNRQRADRELEKKKDWTKKKVSQVQWVILIEVWQKLM